VTLDPIRPSTLWDVAKLACLAAIWGSAFLAVEIAVREVPPVTLAAMRILLGASILNAVVLARGDVYPRDFYSWAMLTVVGFFNSALPFFLIAWGQQHVNTGTSAILMSSGSFVALLLSHFSTRDDRLSLPKALGLGIGFSGVLVLMGPAMLAGAASSVLGQLALIGAASGYATAGVLTRFVPRVSPLASSAVVLASAGLYMIPLALWLDRPWDLAPSARALAMLGYLGVVATALAYLLRFTLIRQVGASFMGQVGYLIPFFAVFWGWLFLGQIPGLHTWLALGFILLGINISRLRPGWLQRQRRLASS